MNKPMILNLFHLKDFFESYIQIHGYDSNIFSQLILIFAIIFGCTLHSSLLSFSWFLGFILSKLGGLHVNWKLSRIKHNCFQFPLTLSAFWPPKLFIYFQGVQLPGTD